MSCNRHAPGTASPRSGRPGFTLVEVMIAGLIAAFVLGTISMSLGQLARAKDTSKTRLDAHLRADAALNAMRRDIASVIRHEDLFWTRLLIRNDVVRSPIGELARDEILVFNTRLLSIHDIDFNGEGVQYETQYRIMEDEHSAVLWQRRDTVPDEYPLAGGIATPLVEGIIALRLEAYDGVDWLSYWDSDLQGLPQAVRITVMASGARNGEDLFDAPIAVLRTVAPIDRVIPPADLFRDDEERDEEDIEEEELEDVSDRPGPGAGRGGQRGAPQTPGAPGRGGARGAGPSPGPSPGPGRQPGGGGGRGGGGRGG